MEGNFFFSIEEQVAFVDSDMPVTRDPTGEYSHAPVYMLFGY